MLRGLLPTGTANMGGKAHLEGKITGDCLEVNARYLWESRLMGNHWTDPVSLVASQLMASLEIT